MDSSRRNFLKKSLAVLTLPALPSGNSLETPTSNPQESSSATLPEWEDWIQTVYDSKVQRKACLTRMRGTETIYELAQDETGSMGVGLKIDPKYLHPQTPK